MNDVIKIKKKKYKKGDVGMKMYNMNERRYKNTKTLSHK